MIIFLIFLLREYCLNPKGQESILLLNKRIMYSYCILFCYWLWWNEYSIRIMHTMIQEKYVGYSISPHKAQEYTGLPFYEDETNFKILI